MQAITKHALYSIVAATLFIALPIAYLLDKKPNLSLYEAMQGELVLDTVMFLTTVAIALGWVQRIRKMRGLSGGTGG